HTPSVRQRDFEEAEAAGHTLHLPGVVNTGTLYDRIKMKKSQKALNLKKYVIRYAGEERP
ncbi:hypothetical protein H6F38_34765, partial [Paenibacillus sp. EKM208P]